MGACVHTDASVCDPCEYMCHSTGVYEPPTTFMLRIVRTYIRMYVHMHVCTYVFMNEGMYTHSYSVCTYMDMSSMYTQT